MSWESWNTHKKVATAESRLRRSLGSPIPALTLKQSVRTGMASTASDGTTQLALVLRKEVTRAAHHRTPSMPVMPWNKS